jgi:hypothetical protein
MRMKLFHVEFQWVFSSAIYKGRRPTATERYYRHQGAYEALLLAASVRPMEGRYST